MRGLTRFPAALDAQFAVNALHLRLDRIDRDHLRRRNLRVGAASGKQAKHAQLGFCQWFQQQRRTRVKGRLLLPFQAGKSQ